MKNKFLGLVLLSIIFLSSCQKTEHDIRFQNQNVKGFRNVVIGPDNFGTVNTGQTTAYMKVPEGSGSISGISTDTTEQLSGTYSVSGKGKHNWTITLTAAGQVTLKEDK